MGLEKRLANEVVNSLIGVDVGRVDDHLQIQYIILDHKSFFLHSEKINKIYHLKIFAFKAR